MKKAYDLQTGYLEGDYDDTIYFDGEVALERAQWMWEKSTDRMRLNGYYVSVYCVEVPDDTTKDMCLEYFETDTNVQTLFWTMDKYDTMAERAKQANKNKFVLSTNWESIINHYCGRVQTLARMKRTATEKAEYIAKLCVSDKGLKDSLEENFDIIILE